MATVSIIIPTLNEEQRLPRCLESLGKQSFEDYEIIVVDSGSSDKTVEIAKKRGARVLYEPRLGVSVAKNFGASEAGGDILVFTDADSTYPEGWLKRMVSHFKDRKVIAAFGPIKPMERKLIHVFLFDLTTNVIPGIAALFGFFMAHGPNQSFRRTAFEKVGGFDERLRILEDNELPNRIKREGKIVFDPWLFVYASTRRFEKEGYFAATVRFLRAYWRIYFQKKSFEEEYPAYR